MCFFDLAISRDTYAWSRPCFRPATKRWWGSQRFLGSGARVSRRSASRDTRGIPGACPESSNGDLRYPLLGNLQYCFFLFQPFSTLELKGHIKHQQCLCFRSFHVRNQIPGVPCGSANNIASKRLCLDWSWRWLQVARGNSCTALMGSLANALITLPTS